MPKIYNSLVNPELQFGILWRLPREYTVRVVGVKKQKTDSLSPIAGDRSFGFPSRRIPKSGSNMTETVDGTGIKKKRKSVARPRKLPCRMVSSALLQRVFAEKWTPELVAERDRQVRAKNRQSRRNSGSRNGRKDPVLITLGTKTSKGRRGGLECSTSPN